jgi:hypothetical protein
LDQRKVLSFLLLMVHMTLLMVPMTLMLTDHRFEQRRVLSFLILMVPSVTLATCNVGYA